MLPFLPAYLVVLTSSISIACLTTLLAPKFSILIPALTTYGKTSLEIKDQPKVLQIIAMVYTFLYPCGTKYWIMAGFHILLSDQCYNFADFIDKPSKIAHTSATTCTAVLVLFLMFLHVLRRCYESLFVSVYSDTKMNIGHYLTGLVHYFILPLTIITEAHGFMDNKRGKSILQELNFIQWSGALLFYYCNWQQHEIVQKMAKLRKTSDGLVSDYLHGIFYGGWFNLVSCPHFLFEIGIYLSFWIVAPMSLCYRYILIFVIVNQIFAALISHRWYLNKFSKYPKNRTAIIPYVL